MSADSGYQGELSGKIYLRMLRFLDEGKGDVRPVDIVRWWAFWEKACPPDILCGRLFWLSLVVSTRLEGDPEDFERLAGELIDWLTGGDETHVEIIKLDDPPPPSSN